MKIKNSIFVTQLVFVILMFIIASPGAVAQIPDGTYLRTSKDVKVVLTCEARKINGQWVQVRLDISDLESANLENKDGELINKSGNARRKGWMPGGSYVNSCRNIKVVLYATCKKLNGQWQKSSLNITSYQAGDIVNRDGVLRIE